MASTQLPLLLAASVLLLGYVLYRSLLPKPIPGIPYNRNAVKSILGDAVAFVKHNQATGEVASFMSKTCIELDSPIVQIFPRPLAKPWVIVSDRAATQDALVRRTPRDFDRSNFFGDAFYGMMPDVHIHMLTNAQWRFNRRLIADTMSASFLRDVAGEQIHHYFSNMIEFWKKKQILAQDHPIDAAEDVEAVMLDAIYAASFGSSVGALDAQKAALAKVDRLDNLSPDLDTVAKFPHATKPAAYTALRALIDSCEIPMASPLGRTHHKFALNFYPYLRKARQLNDRFINNKIDEAWKRFTNDDDSVSNEEHIKCAVDLVIAREVSAAKKEGRAPKPHSNILHDEILGFITAGHDTTGTTVLWGIKTLVLFPDVQQKLREHLRHVFKDAAEAGTSPSAVEIGKTDTPYLDAVVEEIIRWSNINQGSIRQAVQDTEVLGHVIPKGTDVFFLIMGPTYFGPALPAKKSAGEKEKSTSAASKWPVETLADFMPERFLDTDENGHLRYDGRTDFNHVFGAGIRACFGRKMAHLALRIMFTLLVWNFDLRAPPDALATWKATDGIVHRPNMAFLRLGSPKV